MRRDTDLPTELLRRPFSTDQARRAGLVEYGLSHGPWVQLHRGVWAHAALELTLAVRVAAARLVLPPDAALSHHTGARWHGATVGPDEALHFSTNLPLRARREGIELHRRRGTLHPTYVRGHPVLGPDRCFVDAGTTLRFLDHVALGDQLLHLGLTDVDTLRGYADTVHLDGVRAARRRLRHVRPRAESPQETFTRLMIVFARLPEPATNVWVDAAGGRRHRCDLVFEDQRVIVEYDGRWHDATAAQEAYDELRRVRLEAAGWRVVVVKVAHLRDPREVVGRIHAALVAGGYRGPHPVMNDSWRQWFSTSSRYGR